MRRLIILYKASALHFINFNYKYQNKTHAIKILIPRFTRTALQTVVRWSFQFKFKLNQNFVPILLTL